MFQNLLVWLTPFMWRSWILKISLSYYRLLFVKPWNFLKKNMYILLYYCHLQSYQKLTDSNLNLINSLGSKDEIIIIQFFSCFEDCTSDTWIVQQCKNDECVVKHYQNNQQLIEAGFPHVVSTQNLDWQWVTKQAKSSSKYL